MKLKHYSAVAAAFLAMKQETDAQIIYTDIPDSTVYPGTNSNPSHYALDLNNDGQVDFDFSFWKTQFVTGGYQIQFFTLNEYLSSNSNQIEGNMPDAFALVQNDTISAGKPWISASLVYMGYFLTSVNITAGSTLFMSSGNWLNVTDRYLGVRLILNSDTLYGWIRMDVFVKDSVVIKDYAYNTVPGEKILAGEGGIPDAIQTPHENSFEIFPNPAENMLQVILGESISLNAVAMVVDLSGKKILSKKMFPAKNELDISSLPDGIYLLEVKDPFGVSVKKFEVKNK